MAFESSSPNMGLVIPGVSLMSGPQYASDLNASLSIIDQHNHSPGNGVQITPAGLNINADLTLNNNNIINARSVRFQIQASPLALAADLGCLYESGVDLYYNDGNGNQIRITQSGGVVGTPGSISNLTSPASASYVSLSSTFVWQSDANTPANMDFASAIFRNLVANSKGLTLQPPAAMGADYSITLPSLPVSQKIMTLDASGVMSAPYVVDNSTIEVSSNTIQVKALGIGTAQLANDSVTAAKLAAGAVNDSLQSQSYTTEGDDTFVVPTGVTKLFVELQGAGGGGGGGGGGNTKTAGGGAGSAGDYSLNIVDVTPADVINLRVGARGTNGAGGTSNGNGGNGSDGGLSAFGKLIAKGGKGGGGGSNVGGVSGAGRAFTVDGGAGGTSGNSGESSAAFAGDGIGGTGGGGVSPAPGGGGGGGSPSSLGIGGNGQGGMNSNINNFSTASPATVSNGGVGAGGGGGGASNGNVSNSGGAGGNGGRGQVTVYWFAS